MNSELLNKYVNGQSSELEEKIIMEWLDADPKNQLELNALWLMQDTIIANVPCSELRNKHLHLPVGEPKLYHNRFVRSCIQIAATLLLIAGSWYFSRNVIIEDTAKQYVSLSAPTGQRIDITLQDGTTVCLNSGATLEYPIRFGKNRRVKLSGEGMFDVKHDAKHPFIVETFACDIEVLGTKFNVVTDKDAHTFSTALLRGRVKVMNKLMNGDQITMAENDFVCLNGDRLLLTSIKNPDDYLWPEGILNLVGHPFVEIISRLEGLYGVQITIEMTTPPELDIIRGKIPVAMGLDYALRALQKITPFEYERTDANTIFIK